MLKAIVIATTSGREEWLRDCLESLKGYTKYPILVVNQYEWELGKIKWVFDHTDIDEFLFLQDSVIIKEYSWIDEVMEKEGSVSLTERPYEMYMGKYLRSQLKLLEMPYIASKRESVYAEAKWCGDYAALAPFHVMWGYFKDDHTKREVKYGRENLVLENEHIKKYKGTWDISQVPYD